ncbi:MAG: acyltransferase family protein [Bacteroidales bacterium]|nr:acyltransferase family protein [Bacteroidales bacterium]MCM1147028.1 acyltransferase family protein [Bacteroidales bacterium]MCM1205839.1 acyltransferase family protein [Bacillota bacterium]MCM1509919.1 acyltransferase family protein [Clostridium sp.]
MNPTQGNRMVFVDVAKGLSMFFVILGHTIAPGFLWAIVYSFHMPLFFILSGFTTKYANNKSEYLQNIKKHLSILLFLHWQFV